MPRKEQKPRELLADQELIGFTRRSGGDGQVVQRASSAKVLTKAGLREELEQAARPRQGGK